MIPLGVLGGATPRAVASGSGYDDAVMALSPWAYYKMDENPPGSGGTLADSSGNARHGTYSADSWSTTSGLFGGSARCPVFVPADTKYADAADFSHSGKFSLVAFVKTSASGALQQIISADGAPRMFQFRFETDGKISMVDTGSGIDYITSVSAYNDGNPHLVTTVYDGSLAAGSGRLKLYVDNVLDVQSATSLVITESATAVTIGQRNGAYYFDGNISNVAMFQSALSSTDIAALWAARNT